MAIKEYLAELTNLYYIILFMSFALNTQNTMHLFCSWILLEFLYFLICVKITTLAAIA